jgi:hypothetical protein
LFSTTGLFRFKRSLLCLECRNTGHIASDCSQECNDNDIDWFVSPERATFNTDNIKSGRVLCKRCSNLNIIEYLEQDIPWTSAADRGTHSELHKYIRNLGKVGSIRFRKDCPLCRCLFALTPTPDCDDQDVLMLPNWNLNRLEGGVAVDLPEKRCSARGILMTLANGEDVDFSKDSSLDRGDCLAILQEDLSDGNCALGGRRIASTINFDLIHQWLAKCSDLHPITCTPMWNEGLRKIRLVDVEMRAVVPHPGIPCDYVALSYVMGNVEQIVCKVGVLPEKLPRTIENSIEFVRRLGKRYLWVDTLCIDQSDSEEKFSQINRMDLIYRGAFATLISLSGESAESGLPRMGRETPRVPQLTCRIGDKTLVTLMPTLSRQIFTCRWGERAWTLQEALLSRRCIYLSDQQVYFECNSMQCCESINESQSWIHNICRDADFLVDGHPLLAVGAGVLRSPFTGTSQSTRTDRLQMYITLTNLYNYREMTYQSDALHAFSGIVQYLKEVAYPRGFFWGLPLEDLNWALSWVSREDAERRVGFPSWSWTGWQGYKWAGEVSEFRLPQKWPTFLRAFKLADGDLQPLFTSGHRLRGSVIESDDEYFQEFTNCDHNSDQVNDALSRAARTTLPAFRQNSDLAPLCGQLLVIEGLTLTFQLDCSQTESYTDDGYVNWHQLIDIPSDDEPESVNCLLYAIADDSELDRITRLKQPHSFLLLGRQQLGYQVWFTLMSLREWTGDEGEGESSGLEMSERGMNETGASARECTTGSEPDDTIMTRGTVVHLLAPAADVSGMMHALRPEKKRIVLI